MENYTQILEYPNYEVSELGNVRRVNTTSILKPIDNGKGYKVVHLSNIKGRRLCLIHRLVMSTFKPTTDNKDVNHMDGAKSNNNISNLEWVTKSENTRHAHRTGLFSSRNKLSIEQVKEIKLAKDTIKAKVLAEKFDVQTSIIYKIWTGLLYPYV